MNSPTYSPAATRVLTYARIAADRLLLPVWQPLAAPVGSRKILTRGVRYMLLAPALDLRLELHVVETDNLPAVRFTLAARPGGLWNRAVASVVHVANHGFAHVASVLVANPTIATVEAALHELRVDLWDDPTFGKRATPKYLAV
jgi:hypothetical protein